MDFGARNYGCLLLALLAVGAAIGCGGLLLVQWLVNHFSINLR